MLFNSFSFFCFFLVVAAVHFSLGHSRFARGQIPWLFAASLFFYGWWDVRFVPLLLGSMAFNFWAGGRLATLSRQQAGLPRAALAGAIACNLILLGYFKYTNFFLDTLYTAAGQPYTPLNIILPLGISFFTFTQIAFLVDCAKGLVREAKFVHYGLFVSFFPHLLAGPILHHQEMMPQFADKTRQPFSLEHWMTGLTLFILGLAKKVLIADEIAPWAGEGFNAPGGLGILDAWIVALAYTLQIYFDFSGYSDMAVGMAWMLNIQLPINFNSPYRARNIQDFWRHWHMTLSRFLRDYLYIPLGGSRQGYGRMVFALCTTFILGGLWHGANWTFVIWGALHGLGIVTVHTLARLGKRLPTLLAWALTFLFCMVAWVFFRASHVHDALQILSAMTGIGTDNWWGKPFTWTALFQNLPDSWENAWKRIDQYITGVTLLCGCLLILLPRNSHQIAGGLLFSRRNAILLALLFVLCIINLQRTSEFLYFNF